MKELGSGTAYNTHNTTSLIRTLKYVSDILQTEEAFTVEEYKHTHTHTSINTGQHKSTRVNRNQHEPDTNQHESDTSQHELTRV